MKLGQCLNRIAQVQPHFFNSFYRRVRVIRESPLPMASSATVDITHRCSLRCPFCIASDVLEQREMSLPVFSELSMELAGIGRLTLIGGEPFQHSDPAEIVRLARNAATEVEIFTNGLVLGSTPAKAGERVRSKLPGVSADWCTLVLSVDPAHALQMAPGRLSAAVDGLLEAEAAGIVRARFSVTHERLVTGTYLDTDTISGCLAEVSDRLAGLFMERLVDGGVQDTFYFNSVICSLPPENDQTAPKNAGEEPREFLRLEDLVFSPEVAISFDVAGNPAAFSSLASMWSRNPPPATVLGPLEAPELQRNLLGHALGSRLPWLAEAALEWKLPEEAMGSVYPGWLEAWRVAEGAGDRNSQARLLRGYEPLSRILDWDGGHALVELRAGGVLEMIAGGTGDRTLRWGGDEGTGRLDTATLCGIVRGLVAEAETATVLVASLADLLSKLFAGPKGLVAPVYRGERELLGKRVPLHPDESFPLSRVHLPGEPWFGSADELVVRPVLRLMPDGSVGLDFPGIVRGTAQGSKLCTLAMTRLMEGLAVLGGLDLPAAVAQKLQGPLGSLAAGVIPSVAGGVQMPDPDDLVAAFEECTFERNRQTADEHNPELLALLMLESPGHYSASAVRRFVTRALTWLEREAAGGLSDSAVSLLGRLKLRGSDRSRLSRLLSRN